jgi:phosphoribosylamine--glycine ligase
MGAYSPAPVVDEKVHKRVMQEIIGPTLRGMIAEGSPYVGFLYAGLMIDKSGQPKVIEYNCRFGDPEAQPVLFRLRSDLLEACQKAVSGDLKDYKLEFDKRMALGVVMAAGGYPFDYKKGATISGLDDECVDTKVFHAGSIEVDGEIRTNGGRVLCVVGIGDDVRAAADRAYARVSTIDWDQRYYRKDIGHRAMNR